MSTFLVDVLFFVIIIAFYHRFSNHNLTPISANAMIITKTNSPDDSLTERFNIGPT
jgi:hypothetical protein